MLMEYVPDDSGLNFRKRSAATVIVRTSIGASAYGIPEEIKIAVPVYSWAYCANLGLVS